MVAVVACVPLQYDGRAVEPGETFGALPIDALVLRHQGKVTWDRLRVYKRPPPPPPPPPPVEEATPKRRNYRRRDLTPEPRDPAPEPFTLDARDRSSEES